MNRIIGCTERHQALLDLFEHLHAHVVEADTLVVSSLVVFLDKFFGYLNIDSMKIAK